MSNIFRRFSGMKETAITPRTSRSARARRLHFEPLEERTMLSVGAPEIIFKINAYSNAAEDSRGYDVYMLTQGYGIATNAVGSYFHEFIGFANIIIPTPFATENILPSTMQVFSPVSSGYGATTLPSFPTAVVAEQPSANDHWNDNLFAFLAEEQIRSQRKKDKYHETDNWLARFEKLALLELMK